MFRRRRRRRPPPLTRQQQLASKPVRLVTADLTADARGGGRLTVPLQQSPRIGWLFRLPKGATKTFEFDALGKFVWEHCDGKTSVQQIARKLAKAYKVSEREAQVATERFLVMLAKKNLIAAVVPKPK